MTSILSHRRLRCQKIKLVQEKPISNTTIFLGSRFQAPAKERRLELVQPLLEGKLQFDVDSFKVNFCDPSFFQDLNHDVRVKARCEDL
mmetsp:Transcript_5597/g.6574  ORF Transcript_5597/g.6574 Transcript_5597/m.6574 type:complete len:88 (+) Transcript_5597:209-472(+)